MEHFLSDASGKVTKLINLGIKLIIFYRSISSFSKIGQGFWGT
jgi:hypothetical protein